MWAALGNFLKKKAKDKVKDKVKNNVSNLDESKQFLLKVVAASSGSILPILFFSFLVVIIVALPVLVVSEFSDNLKNSKAAQFFEKANNFVTFKGWCSDTDGSCEEKAEQKYYEKLEKINDRYDGKVDIELITATIFYGYNSSFDVNATDENGQNPKFIDYFCEAHGIGFGGEELCKVVVKNNYDEVYDKYGERYLKIAPNYEALRDSNCKDSVTLIGSKIPVVRLGIIPIQFWANYTISEACEVYLFNFADLAQVTFEDNSLTLLYQRAYEEADELASQMIKSSKLNYDEYRDYLIKTYIPDHFYSLYGYKKSEDHEKEIGIIADDIMSFASMKMEKESSQYTYYGSCSYNVAGTTIDSSATQVVLLSCDGQTELERVDLEKYIKGVVYGEVGNTWPDEVLKAQAIAARSFVFTRNETMCPGKPDNCMYGYNPKKGEIRLRNCEADQVYCDYEQGCQKYNYNGFNSIVSGTNNPRLSIYKNALDDAEKQRFESVLNSVSGYVMLNEDNTIYPAGYINTDQNAWNNMYNANNSLDYNQILTMHYWNKSNSNITIGGNCSVVNNLTGEFESWKQCDPRWGSTRLGPSRQTVCSVGCITTSIAILMMKSGTPINVDNFNPGVLAQNINYDANGNMYWSGWEKIAPNWVLVGDTGRGRVGLGTTRAEIVMNIKSLLDRGYYVVITIKGGEGHWAAVDRVDGNNVYIYDPGRKNASNDLFSHPIKAITRAVYFENRS